MGGNHRWEVGDHWHDDDGRMGATGTAGRWATTGTTRMGVWEPVAPLEGGRPLARRRWEVRADGSRPPGSEDKASEKT